MSQYTRVVILQTAIELAATKFNVAVLRYPLQHPPL